VYRNANGVTSLIQSKEEPGSLAINTSNFASQYPLRMVVTTTGVSQIKVKVESGIVGNTSPYSPRLRSNITGENSFSYDMPKECIYDMPSNNTLTVYFSRPAASSDNVNIIVSAETMKSGYSAPESVTYNYTWNCFSGDTPVWTENGYVNFEDLTTDMRVWSKNFESGELELSEIEEIMVHDPITETLLVTVEGLEKSINTTKEHPFYSATRNKFINAGELNIGEDLLMGDGTTTKVIEVKEITHEPKVMYDFNIANNHNAFVGIPSKNHLGGNSHTQQRKLMEEFSSTTKVNGGVLIHNKAG
jgi:hypothetical protein